MILDLQTYRLLTNDLSHYDGDVSSALADAQSLAEDYCSRQFDQGTYTERLRIHGGRAYPSAVPIDHTVSPAGLQVDGSAVLVGASGAGVVNLNYPGMVNTVYSKTDLTYVGGYPAGQAPVTLQYAIAQIANNLLNSSGDAPYPAGVTAISIGDLSMTLKEGLDAITTLDADSMRTLKRYRKAVPA